MRRLSHWISLLLGAGLCLSCAGDDDEAASSAAIQAMCASQCTWLEGCTPTSDRPRFDCDPAECANGWIDIPPDYVLAAFVEAVKRCFDETTCEAGQQVDSKIPEFYCLGRAKQATATPAVAAQEQACLDRRQQCVTAEEGSFNDDWCEARLPLVVSSVRQRLEACWQRACPEIEACLQQVIP